MKLLFVTQKVNQNDDVLGFVHGWLREFAKHLNTIAVICLEKRSFSLPPNVEVYSLGKEVGKSSLQCLIRFYSYIWKLRRHYDAVFVHMNQEYMILAGWLWRLWGKKVVFWYNHTSGSILTKIAIFFAHHVCHTSPYAYTAHTRKSVRMPAGIDTDFFRPLEKSPSPNSILYLGRISPIKRVEILIDALRILRSEGERATLNVYGDVSPVDRNYALSLFSGATSLLKEGTVVFHGRVPNIRTPAIYNAHLLSVNLTPRGNYDKTVLESMACGTIVVLSSEAFSDIVPTFCLFREGDPNDLAANIRRVLSMVPLERAKVGQQLRSQVSKYHDTHVLALKLRALLSREI